MEMIIRSVVVGYVRLFPELLDRFYRNEDMTIVDLITDKVIKKSENKFIIISELKEKIVDLLKIGLINS